MAEPLEVVVNHEEDTITINGVRYGAIYFRTLALAEPGTWLRVQERKPDGAIVVYNPGLRLERMLDAITGQGAICGKT